MKFRLSLCLLFLLAGAPLAAQTRYVAFGDSITEGFGDEEGAGGYPARLQELLEKAGVNAVVINAGFGGERTPEGVDRVAGELAAARGDVLLLMEGTNDITRDIDIETTRQNLNEMARKAEGRGNDVVHATLIPRIPAARNDGENIVNNQLAREIRDLANRRGRRLVDPFELLSGIPGLFERYYAGAGLEGDPVGHLNADGYDLLAQMFFDVLTGIDKVPPVVGATTPENAAQGVRGDTDIVVDVLDFGAGIDPANLALLVNGSVVASTASGDSEKTTLTFDPAENLQGVVTVGLRARDIATPANTVDREIGRFIVAGTIFLVGDVDRNGRVDGADLVRLALRFGARRGERRFSTASDLNNDGAIDGLDLAALTANFGQSSF